MTLLLQDPDPHIGTVGGDIHLPYVPQLGLDCVGGHRCQQPDAGRGQQLSQHDPHRCRQTAVCTRGRLPQIGRPCVQGRARRRTSRPRPASPIANIAYVAGSGTGGLAVCENISWPRIAPAGLAAVWMLT